jgi:aryl-alcohol dehydrogenase-like predicted oxidoreductase
VLVFTKVGYRVGDGVEAHADARAGRLHDAARWRQGISPNDQGLSRGHVVQAVHRSLRRLGREHIDLYQVHRWDDRTPIEETLRVLGRLVRAGSALCASERTRTTRFATMQVLRLVAKELGRSPAELALGWILARPEVSAVLVGAEKPGELRANLGVAGRPLTPDEVDAVRETVTESGQWKETE